MNFFFKLLIFFIKLGSIVHGFTDSLAILNEVNKTM